MDEYDELADTVTMILTNDGYGPPTRFPGRRYLWEKQVDHADGSWTKNSVSITPKDPSEFPTKGPPGSQFRPPAFYQHVRTASESGKFMQSPTTGFAVGANAVSIAEQIMVMLECSA